MVFGSMLLVVGGGAGLVFRPCHPDERAREMQSASSLLVGDNVHHVDYQTIDDRPRSRDPGRRG